MINPFASLEPVHQNISIVSAGVQVVGLVLLRTVVRPLLGQCSIIVEMDHSVLFYWVVGVVAFEESSVIPHECNIFRF